MECEAQKINILLVDDNASNLLALESILEAPDRNLVRAASGDEALRYLLDCDVAVILLDLYMPGIDGLETAALIRGRERSRDIPIIFLTADSTGARHLLDGYSLGAVDFILKPVEPAILRAKVAVFVELFKKAEEVKRQAALLKEQNIELENANLQRLSMLIDLGQRLAAEHNPRRVLETFCASARDIVGARLAMVGMCDDNGDALGNLTSSGFKSPAEADPLEIIGRDGLKSILEERRSFRTTRTRSATGKNLAAVSQDSSVLAAPILAAKDLYGWMCLAEKIGADEFSEADERLAATLTSQVAVAYENARLYEESRRHAAELRQEVAERKQAEEERARLLVRERTARSEAEAANRAKDEFLATLSHELRTPLTSILGWSHLVRSGQLPPGATASALETIERNARAQSQLIDDLLDVSRIITGKLRLEVCPVALASVVEAALDSVRPAAEARNIQFHVNLDPSVRPVHGDASRLQQVMWNLFSNAVKFTGVGGHVDVRLASSDSEAVITVKDTGQGISREFLPHVFDRFRQADGTSTRAHGGLGLGLAIARHLVELHGGTICAESDGQGRGATFSVTLPVAGPIQEQSERTASSVGTDTMNGTGSGEIALDGVRVLVVEDDPDTRELVQAVLSGYGAAVSICASADEALSRLENWHADVLVSDIGFPGEDGFSLIASVRELEKDGREHLPALALTAFAGDDHRARAIRAGFQSYLAKPPDPTELARTVAGLAARRSCI